MFKLEILFKEMTFSRIRTPPQKKTCFMNNFLSKKSSVSNEEVLKNLKRKSHLYDFTPPSNVSFQLKRFVFIFTEQTVDFY